MKHCAYCGRENIDEAARCWECGTDEFKRPAPPDPPPPEPAEDAPPPEPPAHEPRPQVCPRCGMEYDGKADKCFVDGSRLVPLGQPGRFDPTVPEWKRKRSKEHRRIDWLTRALGLAAGTCLFYAVKDLLATGSGIVDRDWPAFWPLLAAGVGLSWLATLSRRSRLRWRQEHEDVLALDKSMPFVLLLRPFGSEEQLQVSNPDRNRSMPGAHEWKIPISQLLSETFLTGPQLRTLGGDVIGPGRVRTPDETWQEEFYGLLRAARGIIVIPLPGKEVAWEIEELRREGKLDQTIFLLPSARLSSEAVQRQPPAESAKANQLRSDTESDPARHEVFLDDLRRKGFQLPRPGEHTLIVALDQNGRLSSCVPIKELTHESIRKALQQRWGPLPGWTI